MLKFNTKWNIPKGFFLFFENWLHGVYIFWCTLSPSNFCWLVLACNTKYENYALWHILPHGLCHSHSGNGVYRSLWAWRSMFFFWNIHICTFKCSMLNRFTNSGSTNTTFQEFFDQLEKVLIVPILYCLKYYRNSRIPSFGINFCIRQEKYFFIFWGNQIKNGLSWRQVDLRLNFNFPTQHTLLYAARYWIL